MLTEAPGELFADLSEVTFVDSTALHVLLRAARQLAAEHGALIVVARDPSVRRAFEITGFDRLLSIVSSVPSGSAS